MPEPACDLSGAASRAAERPPRLSVVIPARDEAARIGHTLSEIRGQLASVESMEIVVVDDGSDDDTGRIAAQSGADEVVVHARNLGKGAAVRSGMSASQGRVVAFTDADLAYAPHRLLDFLDAVEQGCDVAIGTRRRSGGAMGRRPLLRSLGSRAVNLAARIALRNGYGDTQCGCKAFRGDVARFLAAAGTVDRFAFDIEILHLVERYGLTMREIPVEAADSEASSVRILGDSLRLLADIVGIRRRARRGAYPSTGPASGEGPKNR